MLPTLIKLVSFFALTAYAQVNATTNAQPQCIAMCIQCKLVEVPQLAPQCSTSDLSCLCSTSEFTRAYAHCLRDNCANSGEVQQGTDLMGQICANAGVAVGTFTAQTDVQAKQTAVAQIASLLSVSVSGSIPISTPAFNTEAAQVAASSYQVSQGAIATASAIAVLSQAEMQASYSIAQEVEMLSESYDQAVYQASMTAQALATQLPASQYAEVQSQIAATLSMMKVAASQKVAQDQASAQASLAQESQQLFPAATPSSVINAQSSASERFQIQAGLGLLSLVGILMLV